MEEGQKKGKLFAKISKKKLILLVGFFFAIIILAIAGFFLLNKKEEEKGIKVGDTLITDKQISKNAKDMQAYLDKNKNVSFGKGNIEDIAKNDLIANASLKGETARSLCGGNYSTISNLDLYKLTHDSSSDSTIADNYIKDAVSNQGEYIKTRLENKFLQKKLKDCILKHKEITRISILTYGNYYRSLKDKDFKEKVLEAKKTLENRIYSKMKGNPSLNELISYADYDLTKKTNIKNSQVFNYPNKIGIFKDTYGDSFERYENRTKSREAVLADGVDVNKYVSRLSKGEYSPVLIGTNGEVSIFRVEEEKGKFDNWEKFFKESSNEYIISNSKVDTPQTGYRDSIKEAKLADYSTYSPNASCNATISDGSYLWADTRPGSGGTGHDVTTTLTFYVGSSYYTKGGVTAYSSQTPGYYSYESPATGKTEGGPTCVYNDRVYLSAGEYSAELIHNCLESVYRSVIPPKGYKIIGASDSDWRTHTEYGDNGTAHYYFDIYLEEEEHFQTDPQSYIKAGNKNERSYSQYWNRSNPLKVHLGDNVFFKHTNRMYDANKSFTISTSINRSISSDIGYGGGSEGPMDYKSLSYYNGETKTFEGSSLPSSGRYIVREGDIGKTICQSITSRPGAKKDGDIIPSRTSNEVCFYVEPQPWQITASTQIGKNGSGFGTRHLNVNAGDSITWRHSFRNSTSYVAPGFPGNTIENNPHTYTNAGGQKAYGLTNKNQASSRATNDFQFRTNSGNIDPGQTKTTNDSRYTYRVQSSDLGTSLCQRAYATHSRDRGSPTVGEWLCAYVPYHFDITNCIKSPMDGNSSNCSSGEIPVEPGDDVPIIPKVPNKGTRTPRNTKWKITQWEVDGVDEEIPVPTNPVDNRNGNTASHYNEQFRGKGKRFSVKEGEREFQVGENTLQDILRNIKIPDNAPLGQRYCVAVSISAPTMLENETQEEQQAKVGRDWRHSQPLCMLVTKKPKMQVWGNGLYSRGGVVTSVSRGLGSWVEYEALVGGQVKGFKSESSQTTRNLTIDNFVNGAGSFGQGASSINAIKNSLNTKFPRSDGNEVRVDEGVGTFSGVDYRRGGSPIRTHIIKGRDIVINGDIFVRNPIGTNGIKQFQQIIMIAEGNIYIQGNVGNIDAWLIATGDIYTCANGATTGHGHVNQKNCGKHLAVNGPVLANNLHSWRTYGSENKAGMDRSTPAETYNQRADIYMWAQAQASGNGKMLTTFSKELPVRY